MLVLTPRKSDGLISAGLNQQGMGYMYSIDIVGVLLAFSLNDDL